MNKEKIIFYINPQLKVKDVAHIPLLYPFWGVPLTDRSPYNKELFSKYNFDTQYYDIADAIEDADFVLIPYPYNKLKKKHPELIVAFVKEAHDNNKPILIDGVGDIELPIDIKDAYILRYGGYRFENDKYRIQIPPYADDLLALHYSGNHTLRDKQEVPTVGFAGWSSLSRKQYFKNAIKELPYQVKGFFNKKYQACRKGVTFRAQAIKLLEKSDKVNTKFLKRSSYSAHTKTAEKPMEELRKEFIENIYNNDYTLNVRGDANASARLFETLALGRIPLFVDTECILPLSDIIDYKSFCFIIDFREIKNIGEKLREFHNAISNEEFKQMQRRARGAYEKYFRVDSLTQHIMDRLRTISETYKDA